MAIKTSSSTLTIAANKIVSVGKRSRNSLPVLTKEYAQFTNFLDIKINELEAIQLPSTRKIQQLSNLNITNTLGDTGGLLNSLLSGGIDLAGLIRGKESKSGTLGGAKAKPKLLGGKLKLGGLKGIAVVNSIFAGLDFATGLSEGESVGKAAAGAGGSLAGSLLGGAIGQALIPVPGLGFLIGSAAGSFLGGYAADRVADKVESGGKSKGNLRRELDFKIQQSSREQAARNETESSKAFRKSVDNFSVAVNKLGEFLGIRGLTSTQEQVLEEPVQYPEPVIPSPDDGYQGEIEGETFLPLPNATSIGDPSQNQHYGAGRDGGSRSHAGVDLTERSAPEARAPVVAYKTGKVIDIQRGDNSYRGGLVHIDHGNGLSTRYLHVIPNQNLSRNQIVYGGQQIAVLFPYGAGGTGSTHLHFEVLKNGVNVDPTSYAKGAKNKLSIPLSIEDAKAHHEKSRQSSAQITGQQSISNPFVLEVHSVGVGEKQRSGLIPSYLDKETPASRALKSEFGSYPKDFRGGDLGGPRRGMNLIETDIKKGVESNAQRLFNIIRQNPNQHFHLFAGHNDVTMGETGAPGEQEYTRKVCEMIEQMARRQGIRNVTYHRSIISNTDLTQSNWERGRRLREASLKAEPPSTAATPSKGPRFNKKLFEPAPSSTRPNISQYTSLNRNQNSITIIDRPVTTTVMVGGKQKSSRPVVIPVNGGGQSVVVSSGPTPNQLLDGVAELVLLSTFG